MRLVNSASIQHTRQRALLRRGYCKVPGAFDCYPHFGVGAVVGSKWRLPFLRSTIALGLIHVVCYGNQLWAGEIISEGFAFVATPGCCAGLPSVRQRHKMIDIHIRRRGPRRPIKGAIPPPTHSRTTGRVLHHVGPIPFEHYLPGIAGPRLSTPVRE